MEYYKEIMMEAVRSKVLYWIIIGGWRPREVEEGIARCPSKECLINLFIFYETNYKVWILE